MHPTGVDFRDFVDALLREVMRADVDFHLLQRTAWKTVTHSVPLAEGLEYLDRLGIDEIRFEFCIRPCYPSFGERLKRCWRYLRGRGDLGLFDPGIRWAATQDEDAIRIVITVSRNSQQAYVSEIHPPDVPPSTRVYSFLGER
ncbi:MAG: hypothetical protein FJY97_08650 [candidate division Zixibacteria bacterium]|nr:hypothetical protein [candidate division Zixibacteria bacterium]